MPGRQQVTAPTIELVKKTLEDKGFTIKKEGELDGPTIGDKKCAVFRDEWYEFTERLQAEWSC